ncbi:MAG: glycogen debranching enzyme N-terminal domain-containing protein, partial [Anaerolineae bacterium]|nr:glycogen debranching enzyme N-terminal domain-containing protein [Anaerolineae bacterium]
MLNFGREVCGSFEAAAAREWLVTNGIGGYASGTVAGVLTRRYHGLLIAALKPPLGRTLMLTKLDETVAYGGRFYELFTNCWPKDVIDPHGYQTLEAFCLEGTTPVWTFACADAQIQKRVWMQPGANTTYVRYDVVRGSGPLTLTLKALVNYRDHHGWTRCRGDWMRVEPVRQGLRIVACDDATPFYLFSESAQIYPKHAWHYGFYLSAEAARGMEMAEDHLQVGDFQATLEPGESLTLVASTTATPELDGGQAFAERQAYEQQVSAAAALDGAPPEVRHLALAADQFVVRRDVPGVPEGYTILAGYPWFADWG